MTNIINYINTLCLIYIITNPKTRGVLLTTINRLYAFLLKVIDDEFKRHENFIKKMVEDLKEPTFVTEVINEIEKEIEKEVLVENDELLNEVLVEKEEEVKEVKFEDKYLQKFKTFINEYSFTEDEKQLERQKFDELRQTFINNKTKEIDEITRKINKLQKIVDCVTADGITDDGVQRIIKYYDIEYEYNEDPDNYMLSDLIGEVSEILTESCVKLKEQEEQNITEDELKEQAYQYMLNKKLDGFINNYVLDMTPLGNIYMRYNNSKKSFEYFSNNTIPYRYLEPVGRKYVMMYFCKPLFVDIEDELKKAQNKNEQDKKEQTEKNEQKEKVNEQGKKDKDMFAKLKPYNSNSNNNIDMAKMGSRNTLPPQIKANLPNVNTSSEEMLLKENANRYTWEGRLANMSILKKVDRKVVDKNYSMSFADFKQLQKQNK
jgi:hypothetical protein